MDWCCCLCCQAYYLQQSLKVHFYLASAHCRLRLLFVADIVFCFLSPCFTRLDGFCMWRTFSVQHFCKVNLPFCQLQPVWAYLQWPLSPFLFLTIHKTDDFRHNTPYKIVTVTSLLPSGLLFYYVLYLNLPFVSLFFVSSNFSRSVWAMTKMLVHSVTLMIPYKNLHDLKKKMEGLQSHSTSWVDLNAVTIYPLHFFTLNGDMRDSKWFLSQLQASLPGIQRALGALILIIKPSHCSELTWHTCHTSVHLLHYLSNSESWEP